MYYSFFTLCCQHFPLQTKKLCGIVSLGIRFINVSAPMMSKNYNDEDFTIVIIDGKKLTYNGTEL